MPTLNYDKSPAHLPDQEGREGPVTFSLHFHRRLGVREFDPLRLKFEHFEAGSIGRLENLPTKLRGRNPSNYMLAEFLQSPEGAPFHQALQEQAKASSIILPSTIWQASFGDFFYGELRWLEENFVPGGKKVKIQRWSVDIVNTKTTPVCEFVVPLIE